MLHHVSRHLSDRAKTFAIAWNIVGARVLNRTSFGDTTIDVVADAGRVTQHAYVDYAWVGDADVVVRHRFNQHSGVFAHGFGEVIGTNPALSSRGSQTGAPA